MENIVKFGLEKAAEMGLVAVLAAHCAELGIRFGRFKKAFVPGNEREHKRRQCVQFQMEPVNPTN